jgi:hypothetical protein
MVNRPSSVNTNTTTAPTERPVTNINVAIRSPPPVSVKMKWGTPTWLLLHTLVAKLKLEHFDEIKSSLISIVKTICINVPCPICSTHAAQYIKKINFNSIQTKEDLQMFLFNFHNDINTRLKSPIFSKNELIQKYSTGQLINIFNNFMANYKVKNYAVRLIADNMYRDRVMINITSWFKVNLQKFELN